jgi:hypothetical protein
MRLADDAGRLHEWRTLAAELTPQQLAELQAYRRLYPWQDDRDDLRHALMTSVVAGAWGGEVDVGELAMYMEKMREQSLEENVLSPEAAAAMMRGLLSR